MDIYIYILHSYFFLKTEQFECILTLKFMKFLVVGISVSKSSASSSVKVFFAVEIIAKH